VSPLRLVVLIAILSAGCESPTQGLDATANTDTDGGLRDAVAGADGSAHADASLSPDAAAPDATAPDATAPDAAAPDAAAPDAAAPDAGEPCAPLDEAACILAGAGCVVRACHLCGNQVSYLGCAELSDPPLGCPGLGCLQTCAGMNEQDCTIVPDCHPVYVDQGATFSSCAEGKTADCSGHVMCRVLPPTCSGDFTVSVAAGCYEGCVHRGECAH
jgi:hypothetical protein